jgi:hypothetical protein
LGRSIAAYDEKASALIGSTRAFETGEVLSQLDELYPTALRAELAKYRERREEESLLAGLSDGVLTAPGGVIRYRGREIRKKELPGVIESVRTERREIEKKILEHDRLCRATHLAAARLIGRQWPEHLEGLVELTHCAVHTLRSAGDAYGYLHHVLQIVLADGRVSSAEQERVHAAAVELCFTLSMTIDRHQDMRLPDDVSKRVEEAGGLPLLSGRKKLYEPIQENLGEWLQDAEAYTPVLLDELDRIADASLEALLEAEAKIASALRSGTELEPAPERAKVPTKYPTCPVGQERKRQKKLDWWDRFQTADGVVPGTMRAVVACGLLVPALLIGGNIGKATVHVVNGLSVPVMVELGEQKVAIGARQHGTIEAEPSAKVHVRAQLMEGRPIEDFEGELGGGFSHAVYNVAQAAAFLEWTAVYGPAPEVQPRPLGAGRWFSARQDHVFEEPPRTVSLKSGEVARHTVLAALHQDPPDAQLQWVPQQHERDAIITAHLAHEPAPSEAFARWLTAAEGLSDREKKRALLLARAKENRGVVVLEREIQDLLGDEERANRCAETRGAADDAPADGNLAYLALRCELWGEDRGDAWVAGWEQHRANPWFSWAAADELAGAGRWRESLEAYETALTSAELSAIRDRGGLFQYLRIIRVAEAAGHAVTVHESFAGARELALLARIAGAPAEADDTTVRVYRALERGELEAALRELLAEDPHVLTLIAASDGASEAIRERAVGLRLEDLKGTAVALSIALRIRQNVPFDPPKKGMFNAALEAKLIALLKDPKLASSPSRLEALVASKPPWERATALAMGAIVLGDRAPPSWRSQAKLTLYPFERPYFR